MVTPPVETASADPKAARRKLPAAERRVLIEEAAARLFAERGLHATTVEEIAAAAGVSKPMLYRHFESKRELAMKLLERRRDELAAAPLDQYLSALPAHADVLCAMLDAWFAHVQAHPYSSRLLFQDAIGDPDVRALQLELRARQRAADVALLRELAPDLPEAELEPLGEIIRSSLSGLAQWWLENPRVELQAVIAAMLRMTRGLVPGGVAAQSAHARSDTLTTRVRSSS